GRPAGHRPAAGTPRRAARHQGGTAPRRAPSAHPARSGHRRLHRARDRGLTPAIECAHTITSGRVCRAPAGGLMSKGTIGILTGGGDVPGLNPAIRAITIRALREGYRVLGLRRGWAGIVDLIPDRAADNRHNVIELTEDIVNRAGRTGGTFLHTSRTRPSRLPRAVVPDHLRDRYTDEINDATPSVLSNLEFLGLD